MENKTLGSAIKTIDVTKNPENERAADGRKKKTKDYGSKGVALKRNYNAISKYGDTLEISESGKTMFLEGDSEVRIKELYTDGKIAKQ